MNISIVVLLSLTIAATEKPVKVETWHDRAVDFSALKTFDFDYEATSKSRGRSGRPLASQGFSRDAEMRETITAALEQRGYRHTPDEEVDFLVVCQYRPPQAGRKQGGSSRAGISPGFSLTFGKANDNAIYIELREPEQRLPIWRGTGLRVQVRKAPITERINFAIETVLATYPPAPHTAPIERMVPTLAGNPSLSQPDKR